MIGIVDVGGGLRGVYSSGIYDCFMDNGFKADYGIGVSAGAANLITYFAGQRGRTLEFYRTYSQRREYMSVGNILKKGSLLNLEYFFTTISNHDGENPLDYEAFKKADIPFYAVATKVSDGEAAYFGNDSFCQDNYDVLRATCSLPVVARSVKIGSEEYLDGGLSDPIPIEKAFADGCDKVILVLTKKREDYLKPISVSRLLKKSHLRNKTIAILALSVHLKCQKALKIAEEYEKQGKVIIIEPEDCFGMKTFTKNTELIMKLYESGYEDARKVFAQSRAE